MSGTAWDEPMPKGPLCKLCGNPLRLDLGIQHECADEQEQHGFAWVEHLALVVLLLGVFALAYVLTQGAA